MRPFSIATIIASVCLLVLHQAHVAATETHGFELKLSAGKTRVSVGQPVYLAAELYYGGDTDIVVKASLVPVIAFNLKGGKPIYASPIDNPQCEPLPQASVVYVPRTIKKGEKFVETKILFHRGDGRLWIDKPGVYEVCCEFFFFIEMPGQPVHKFSVQSEAATIIVEEPRGEDAEIMRQLLAKDGVCLLAPADLRSCSCGGASVAATRMKEAERLLGTYPQADYADRLRLGMATFLTLDPTERNLGKAEELFDSVRSKDKEYYLIRLDALNEAKGGMPSSDRARIQAKIDQLAKTIPDLRAADGLNYLDIRLAALGYAKNKSH